jgi:ribonuclease-3
MATQKLSAAELAETLSARTGFGFRDHERLRRALTHASARHSTGIDYERMEFLGDRVLGLVIAEFVFTRFPEALEGELSRRLNALVNADTLAGIADEIGLSELVHTGSELRKRQGGTRVNIRADAMEALIAAIYLDGGLDAARAFILRFWEPRSQSAVAARRDPKTELQEWSHQLSGDTPVYTIESREGPDHDPVFTVSVAVVGIEPAIARGKSKREAEQTAAAEILRREGVWKSEETAQ